MTRRNFFRRLAGGLAAVFGLAKAGPTQAWSVSTQGATAYTGSPWPVVRLQAKRLACVVPLPPELLDAGWMTLNEVRALEAKA